MKSCVYIAPLRDGSAFKVGKSDKPMRRLTQLSYLHDFNLDKIVVLQCPTVEQTFRTESLLHYVLEEQQSFQTGDGGTEFFSMDGYDTAVQVCVAIVRSKKSHRFLKFVVDTSVEVPIPSDVIRFKVAEKIRDRRLGMNLTLSALAKAAGVSQRTVERLEHNGQINLDNLSKIVSVMGLDLLSADVNKSDRKRARVTKEYVGLNDHELDNEGIVTTLESL